MEGIIFDIQHYCIYDGPGIRTCVFFKGCPLRCAWCHNPESQLLKPQISYFREKCGLCGACVKACPQGARRVGRNGVARDDARCMACGSCANACSSGATELIGRKMSVGEIIDVVSRDRPFYENSGGGVTVTGGEPVLQKEFLFHLLSALKQAGIHTAIETCGHFDPEIIPELLGVVDLFLFDLKHPDGQLHEKFTGVSNEKIISVFKALVSQTECGRIIARIPLIPGVNTDPGALQGIIDLLKETWYAAPVQLMPYNNTARSKWEKIGRSGEFYFAPSITDEEIKIISEQFERAGLEVECSY